MMSRKNPRLVYHRLAIIASSPTTEIRLGPDAGHLIQKETGELKISLRLR